MKVRGKRDKQQEIATQGQANRCLYTNSLSRSSYFAPESSYTANDIRLLSYDLQELIARDRARSAKLQEVSSLKPS